MANKKTASPADEMMETPKKRKSPVTIVLTVVVLLLVGGLIYMFWINQSLRQPEVQTKIAEEANQQLIEKVSQLILVPDNESPTLAKIVNVENLKKTNPDFYEFAQNGDRLIFYSSKAIIYREEDNIIINVAPVIVRPVDEDGVENQTPPEGTKATESIKEKNTDNQL